ncbi:MAG: GDSL-type esterase/lipase family protein [Bacteroidetes bacterium]|nr:GDSL-type esterase/lipase family protein [Bacteroidota bacterium]
MPGRQEGSAHNRGHALHSQATGKPRKIFYAVLIIVPVLFFVLLEAGLRLFNYGYDFTQWVEPVDGKYVLNPGIAHKYFYDMRNVPYSNGDIFDERKKPNAFRVFVLGESSAAGYPFTPIGSFSRYIQQRLSLEYPGSKIEVVNCSMTAINSYAMLDMFPGILREKPDLILFYAGHNEYYGALGVGSMESFGTSRTLVNLVIYLQQFSTFQLLRNALRDIAGMITKKEAPSGTLMARMAQNQYIPLNSITYRKGIHQFESNMHDMLEMAEKQHVPVILGTLACNLKDQYPFVSVKDGTLPPADKIFLQAREALSENHRQAADSLFRFAKDLDALRFRAPTEINKLILNLGKEFGYPTVNIDSAFDAASPDHIAGDNLMTDHLHPTLQGYQLIGKLFYRVMERNNLLPKSKPLDLSDVQQDSAAVASFPFTGLDSVIGEYRIKLLKNDWPYIDKKDKIPDDRLIRPRDFIDSVAYELVEEKISWEEAHVKAADWYLSRNNVKSFLATMNVLISEYPIVTNYYDYVANVLLQLKDYDTAYYYLDRRDEMGPSAFATKYLGIIELSRGRTDRAEKFLNESLKLDSSDAQVWYNLSGVYVHKENYAKAFQMVNRALAIRSDYPEAIALRRQLQEAVK